MEDNVKRVSVNFSQQAYRDLADLADQQGTTVSETLRRAIALNKKQLFWEPHLASISERKAINRRSWSDSNGKKED